MLRERETIDSAFDNFRFKRNEERRYLRPVSAQGSLIGALAIDRLH